MKRSEGIVWYDRSSPDHRVWCVKRGDEPVVRAAEVMMTGRTQFVAEGRRDLQPGGPRGVIIAEELETVDEVPCE